MVRGLIQRRAPQPVRLEVDLAQLISNDQTDLGLAQQIAVIVLITVGPRARRRTARSTAAICGACGRTAPAAARTSVVNSCGSR